MSNKISIYLRHLAETTRYKSLANDAGLVDQLTEAAAAIVKHHDNRTFDLHSREAKLLYDLSAAVNEIQGESSDA